MILFTSECCLRMANLKKPGGKEDGKKQKSCYETILRKTIAAVL